MYLERLHVLNYRCFEEVILELPETGLILITGRNNVGKSALLKAIDELFSESSGGGTNARDPKLRTYVEGRFRLSDEDKELLFTGSRGHSLDLAYPMRLVRHRNAPAGQDFDAVWTLEVAEDKRLSIDKLGLPNVPPEEAHRRVGAISDRFAKRFFHFDPVRTGAHDGSSPLQSSESLQRDGGNLGPALLYLLSRRADAFGSIQELLTRLVPDAGKLTTPTDQRGLSVQFVQDGSGHAHNIKQLGTGVEQLVMTAYAGYRHPAGALLLLEEPEAHLHAGAQRQLAEQLNTWAESHQILVATHSPIFVDARQPDRAQVLLVERDGDRSSVRSADHELPDVLRELGVRLSDVLSAEHVLVVEGPSDEAVLREWFGDLLVKHRVTIVPAAGGDLSFQADKLGAWLEELTELDRNFLFIRDRDELTEGSIDRLEGKGVHVLAKRELENYLCEPAALKKYLELDLSEDEIEQQLRQVADGLRPRVIMKRLVAHLRDMRWMERRDADDLLAKNADAAVVTAFYRERLEALTEQVERTDELMKEIEADVAARWDAEWSALAPGEELLRTFILQHRPNLGYSKTRDAAPLASHLAEPPAELRELLEERLRGPGAP